FVPKDPTVRDCGDVPLEDVQIGSADRGGVNPYNRVRRFPELGLRNFFPRLPAGPLVDECLHVYSLLLGFVNSDVRFSGTARTYIRPGNAPTSSEEPTSPVAGHTR